MKNSNKRFFVNVFLQIVACLYAESPMVKGLRWVMDGISCAASPTSFFVT